MSVLKNACTCWGLAKHLDCPSIQEWMWPGGISRVCVWLHPQRGIFEMPMTSRNHWLFEGYFCLWSELRCSESKVVLVYSISIQLSLGIWNMEMCNSMFFPAKYCIQLGKERKKKNLNKQTNKKKHLYGCPSKLGKAFIENELDLFFSTFSLWLSLHPFFKFAGEHFHSVAKQMMLTATCGWAVIYSGPDQQCSS